MDLVDNGLKDKALCTFLLAHVKIISKYSVYKYINMGLGTYDRSS